MSEVLAALFGALVAGGLQTIISVSDRRRISRSILMAIAAEVQTICALIRHQEYLEAFQASVAEIENGSWDGKGWLMDIRSHYFSVFEANSSNIGCLDADHIAHIVTFYGYCKSAIDSTRPDGPFAGEVRREDLEGNVRSVAIILENILRIGDAIVQIPQNPRLPNLKNL